MISKEISVICEINFTGCRNKNINYNFEGKLLDLPF